MSRDLRVGVLTLLVVFVGLLAAVGWTVALDVMLMAAVGACYAAIAVYGGRPVALRVHEAWTVELVRRQPLS